MKKRLFWSLMFLSACGAPKPASPPQTWNDVEIRVETEPAPPRVGMNEVKVVISKKHGIGAKGYVVSMRADDIDSWQQAFPDGELGIYHGAVRLKTTPAVLQVQIKSEKEETTLRFAIH